MYSDVVIKVSEVSKNFEINKNPAAILSKVIRENWLGGAFRSKTPQTDSANSISALKNISFEVKRGETIGIIGRNGSGKSTLLQIICGTLTPSTGTVHTHGRIAALLELGSGFNPEYTGRENVFLNAQILGLTREQIENRLDDIISFADIGDFLDQPVKTYSSGMFVRLAFAVIAHVDADILIIDEALAVGDAFFSQKCMRFIRNFMKTGTVLFVSHDTGSIKNLCSRAIWLEKGEILEQGAAKDVADLYLQAFYEAQQGKSTKTVLKRNYSNLRKAPVKDSRHDLIIHSNIRNDLKVESFISDAASFGAGKAEIIDVHISDASGAALAWIVGGEEVSIVVRVMAHEKLNSAIVGFYFKDKLGQYLFGDNTYITYIDNAQSAEPNDILEAAFTFQMPYLTKGDYSLCVAVAEGTQESHEQQHWIHDALFIRCDNSSVATGILGIPMHKISMTKLAQEGSV